MILTITLNPAVDISYKLDRFSLDTVNRVHDVSKTAGGKGLNVSRVLLQLGQEVAASGFLGGSLGDYIRTQISMQGIHNYFVKTKGETRNCIAVIHDGQQTEILESGPKISDSEADEFLEKISDYVQKVEIVTISGSLPKGLADDFYKKIVEIAADYDTPVFLDTKGKLLVHTLNSGNKPYLIKPNQDELTDLFGKKFATETQIIEALKSPTFTGVTWVVVTTGAQGAIVKHGQTIYRVKIPNVDAVNPVGSGDSVIAGFAAGLSHGLSDEALMKYGLTMGVLNAMEEKTGYINPEKIDWCIEQISVEKISERDDKEGNT